MTVAGMSFPEHQIEGKPETGVFGKAEVLCRFPAGRGGSVGGN
jgi:hypothetical protein